MPRSSKSSAGKTVKRKPRKPQPKEPEPRSSVKLAADSYATMLWAGHSEYGKMSEQDFRAAVHQIFEIVYDEVPF